MYFFVNAVLLRIKRGENPITNLYLVGTFVQKRENRFKKKTNKKIHIYIRKCNLKFTAFQTGFLNISKQNSIHFPVQIDIFSSSL